MSVHLSQQTARGGGASTAPAWVRRVGRSPTPIPLSEPPLLGVNLPILAGLANDARVATKVQLVYIDPPFATQTVFHSRSLDHAYEDVAAGMEYLELLRLG